MAKKVTEAVVVPVVPEKPYILVEESSGGEPYRLETSEVFEPRERGVTVDGVRYEHCAEDVNGRWVYRASR